MPAFQQKSLAYTLPLPIAIFSCSSVKTPRESWLRLT
jgi:hypothetical protein